MLPIAKARLARIVIGIMKCPRETLYRILNSSTWVFPAPGTLARIMFFVVVFLDGSP
jgi:hypothetical protein